MNIRHLCCSIMAENLCDYKMSKRLFDSPENVNNNNNYQTPHPITYSSTDSEDGFENYLSKVRIKSPSLKDSPSVIIVSDSSDVEYSTPVKHSEIDTLDNALQSLEISKPELIIVDSDSFSSDTEVFSTPQCKPSSHTNFVTPVPVFNTPRVVSSVSKKFNSNRDTLANGLYYLYNETVFTSQLPKDLKLIWNKNLTKTAGYCVYKFDKSQDTIQRNIAINLSTKIITDEDRLKATLIHEMCHAATWIINGVKEGHGHIWKGWAYKASQVYPDYPPITRCHSFSIETKFKYRCINCYYTVGRHSKSIDTTTKCCPLCRSRIELLPLTDKKGNPRKLNLFAEYVKENYGSLEKSLTHKDKMKSMSESYKELKLQSTPI